MAGHSKFKNIMHRKGAQDARRAKRFARLIKELQVAARSSLDINNNPRLRTALSACKSANMPKENIDRVLKKASSGEQDNIEEVRYEGFGPGGVGIIVEAVTDNRNRTASEVRSSFAKFSGNLGETGSVSYLFKNIGQISYSLKTISEDEILDFSVELGAIDINFENNNAEISTNLEDFNQIRENMEGKLGSPEHAEIIWVADNLITADEEKCLVILKLLETLDNCDDVQSVFSNLYINDKIIEKFNY